MPCLVTKISQRCKGDGGEKRHTHCMHYNLPRFGIQSSRGSLSLSLSLRTRLSPCLSVSLRLSLCVSLSVSLSVTVCIFVSLRLSWFPRHHLPLPGLTDGDCMCQPPAFPSTSELVKAIACRFKRCVHHLVLHPANQCTLINIAHTNLTASHR